MVRSLLAIFALYGLLQIVSPAAIAAEARARRPEHTNAAGIAVWCDAVPTRGTASDPKWLASLLEDAGLFVKRLSTEDLSDAKTFQTGGFQLLVLPYGGLYPASGVEALQGYLRSGGNLLTLGGPAFREPIYRSSRGWVARGSIASPTRPPRPIAALTTKERGQAPRQTPSPAGSTGTARSQSPFFPEIIKQAPAGQEGKITLVAESPREETGTGTSPDTVLEREPAPGSEPVPLSSPALRFEFPDLKSYYYGGFKLRGGPEQGMVHFRARGDEETRYLCVDAVESDGSHWKAVVALSREWQTYDIPGAEFFGYASPKRGGPGDFFHTERAARIGFGFPASLVGKGKRSFEISQIQWRESDVPQAELLRGRPFIETIPALRKAFGSALRYSESASELPAFTGSVPYGRVAGLRAAPGQTFFPADVTTGGPFSGSTIEIAANSDFLRSSASKSVSAVREDEPAARLIQLLLTPDGHAAASLLVHAAGPFAGSRWACFGIGDREVFPPGDRERGRQFVALVKGMVADPILVAIEPRFTVRDGRVWMEATATIAPGAAEGGVELAARLSSSRAEDQQITANASSAGGERRMEGSSSRLPLTPDPSPARGEGRKKGLAARGEGRKKGLAARGEGGMDAVSKFPVVEKTRAIHVERGRVRKEIALDVDSESFDWRDFRLECSLVVEGREVDRHCVSLDVRETLLAICEKMLSTQRERGDGKFSGIGFVDNRGARALLAAYDLTGKQEYRRAAIAWGNAIVREQRPDGGYRMGYGQHPEGEECFVADGGEIACGIGWLAGYAEPQDRQRFVDSLQAYMAYRDSFRSPGGGIGVGWCKKDFGARPIRTLDKVTKIFAPEENLYTIGCTLASATLWAQLSENPKDNQSAAADAAWWMKRCRSLSSGAAVESAVWAHKFLPGQSLHGELGEMLRTRFLPLVVETKAPWWTTGGGRMAQGLDGLAYYYDCVKKDPAVAAALLRATYHLASADSLTGIPRLLDKEALTTNDWIYLNYTAVSLPNLLEPEITRTMAHRR